jgi:hypothetical protein
VILVLLLLPGSGFFFHTRLAAVSDLPATHEEEKMLLIGWNVVSGSSSRSHRCRTLNSSLYRWMQGTPLHREATEQQ